MQAKRTAHLQCVCQAGCASIKQQIMQLGVVQVVAVSVAVLQQSVVPLFSHLDLVQLLLPRRRRARLRLRLQRENKN